MKTNRLLAILLCSGMSALFAGCGGGSSGSSYSGSGGNGGGTQAPTVTSISPATVTAGAGPLTLTVNGSGFISTTTVQVGGIADATTYVTSSQVTAAVPASQLATGGQLSVIALNGSASSGSGTPFNLLVNNPAPTITSVAPTTVLAGMTSQTVTVTGTGFVPTTQIDVNGNARTTTYTSSTQVSVALAAADVSATGSLSLTAVNATPGGGTSTASTVAVNDPLPAVTAVSPRTVLTGAGSSTISVTGTNFVPASTVLVNNTSVTTTYVSSTQLTFSMANQSTSAIDTIAVMNPAPGGGTVSAGNLFVLVPTSTPVITSVSPTQLIVGSGATSLIVYGSNLMESLGANSYYVTGTVQWNGTALQTSGYLAGSNQALIAQVPASLLNSAGSASITVASLAATPSTSNAVTLPIVNPPPPTLTSISPAGGPINTATSITLYGTGFTSSSTVAINGNNIASQWVSSTELTATIPAGMVLPGNLNVTVTTPPPGGGTTAPQVFSAFISIPNNDLVYNSVDGLLYASVPAASAGGIGNAVVGIDPFTGTITRQIQVGTNPNKLALSTDGSQLFVGIDGASAVAQISLPQGKIVNQFTLGGGPGIYNPPYTALYLAAVPGQPNSVAVSVSGSPFGGNDVVIFDSGVARTGSSVSVGQGPLSFGSSASTLYLGSSYVDALTVGATGITSSTQLAATSGLSWLQYDNGSLYLSNGQVLNAASGTLKGTFYSSGSSQASGPVASDSALGRAFMAVSNFSNTAAIYIFDETSFNLVGSIPVNDLGTSGYPTNFRKIVRWGQNGVAVAAVPSSFTSNNQIYIFQSPLVKDVSSAPADLSVSLTAPATATTGTAISYVVKVTNAGPNAAAGAALSASVDSSLIINSITASQGSCTAAAAFTCDLGGIANGASLTVTVNATPTNSGSLAASASVSSSSYDPTLSNNQATASATVTGSLYGAAPAVSSISPNLVQAGSAAFTLTVNGTGFNAESTVNLGTNALVTTYISSTQLTAAVTAAEIAKYGWAPVTVTNPSPGGGVSSILPLTIYDLINLPANSIQFDPYGQSLYATIASNATGITGNSLVAINPFTGALGTPVTVGSQPTVMAETSDGDYLYIGLSGASSLAKYNLLNQSLTAVIPISITQYGSTTSFAASWLAAMPGTDNTLAVNEPGEGGTFGILDISGSTGTFRPNFSGTYNGDNPVFASPTELYAYDDQTSGAEFYRYSVNANGLSEIDGTTLNGIGGYGGGFEIANGLVYGESGGIVNPSTTPPSQIQKLPLIDFYGSGDVGASVAMAVDPSTSKEFLMLENLAGTSAYGLVRYDLNTYLPETFLEMPTSVAGLDSAGSMFRFGQSGLAILTVPNSTISPSASAELILIQGPFVTPQLLGSNSAATLSSAPALTHGSGNAVLTLAGANFAPGVAITWNGSYRTTTIVDTNHVTVNIPASDLTSTGSASVIATNPGAPASNTLTITIN